MVTLYASHKRVIMCSQKCMYHCKRSNMPLCYIIF